MSCPEDPASLQDADELATFIALLREHNITSYLEVGARYGGTLLAVAREVQTIKRVAGGGPFGDDKSVLHLLAAVGVIREAGIEATAILGPSSAPEVVARARALAPFDAILIDADHAYQAAKNDFDLYATMGTIVALHDAMAPDGLVSKRGTLIEVGRLWREVKAHHRWSEIETPGSGMGFGIIHRTIDSGP